MALSSNARKVDAGVPDMDLEEVLTLLGNDKSLKKKLADLRKAAKDAEAALSEIKRMEASAEQVVVKRRSEAEKAEEKADRAAQRNEAALQRSVGTIKFPMQWTIWTGMLRGREWRLQEQLHGVLMFRKS